MRHVHTYTRLTACGVPAPGRGGGAAAHAAVHERGIPRLVGGVHECPALAEAFLHRLVRSASYKQEPLRDGRVVVDCGQGIWHGGGGPEDFEPIRDRRWAQKP